MNITIELLPDARSHITINANAQFKAGSLPISSGNLSLELSAPGSRQLTLDLSADATFTEEGLSELSEQVRTMLSIINVDVINSYIALYGLEGENLAEALSKIPGIGAVELPPRAAGFKIENIEFTKFSWKDNKIQVGLTITISGIKFENKFNLSLDARLIVEDNNVGIDLTFNGYFDLPRVENTVQWNVQTRMEEFPALENLNLENLDVLLRQYDVDFTMKVPSDASVSGLPPGYSQINDTYAWSGSNAAEALNLVFAGAYQPNISYGYKPSSGPSSEPSSGFPWLWVGVLIVVLVVAGVVVVVLRRR